MSVPKVGWAEGVCPRCGRIWRMPYPADTVICDCYRICEACGEEMTPYIPDLNPATYRSEEADDPSGSALDHEATVRTRFRCERCMVYSDGVPVEVELR
jgi:hypothetical protein